MKQRGMLYNRKTEPGAANLLRMALIDAVKPLEHVLNLLLRNTYTRIRHVKNRFFAAVFKRKVNVYGKNLFKFASLTASGYTFSGSSCKIVNPTSAYHYCNGTEFMLNPGTYTYSCTVSGEVEYTASNAFRTFYEFNGTQYTLNMDGFGGGTQKYSATFTVTAPTTFKFKHVWFYGMPASANLSIDFQLEIGGKMTEYEPYIEPQTASPQTSFAEGEVFLVETFTAVSPTMTVVARDDNNLISTVDVTYNRDIGKALAAMS